MSNEKNKIWLPVILIAAAILIWMSILAAGAYWAPNGTDGEGGDIRKIGVVAGTTGLFFLFWGFVLYRTQLKLRQKRGLSDDSASQKP